MDLIRQTFKQNRTLEFFSEKELSMQLGHSRRFWPIAILKELIDNSLDACETAGGRESAEGCAFAAGEID